MIRNAILKQHDLRTAASKTDMNFQIGGAFLQHPDKSKGFFANLLNFWVIEKLDENVGSGNGGGFIHNKLERVDRRATNRRSAHSQVANLVCSP